MTPEQRERARERLSPKRFFAESYVEQMRRERDEEKQNGRDLVAALDDLDAKDARITALEAENAEMREALTAIRNCGGGCPKCGSVAGAALGKIPVRAAAGLPGRAEVGGTGAGTGEE